MPRPGVLIYQCRLCGERKQSLHVPDVQTALLYASGQIGKAAAPDWCWNSFVLGAMDLHQCGDGRNRPGRVGVADLVGAVEDAGEGEGE